MKASVREKQLREKHEALQAEHNRWMAILYAMVRREGRVRLTRGELERMQQESQDGSSLRGATDTDGTVVVDYVSPEGQS